MQESISTNRYKKDVNVLRNLLRCYGKLDPEAAARTLRGLTERLVTEIRQGHPDYAVKEVER